jgi:hypothetical protein
VLCQYQPFTISICCGTFTTQTGENNQRNAGTKTDKTGCNFLPRGSQGSRHNRNATVGLVPTVVMDTAAPWKEWSTRFYEFLAFCLKIGRLKLTSTLSRSPEHPRMSRARSRWSRCDERSQSSPPDEIAALFSWQTRTYPMSAESKTGHDTWIALADTHTNSAHLCSLCRRLTNLHTSSSDLLSTPTASYIPHVSISRGCISRRPLKDQE